MKDIKVDYATIKNIMQEQYTQTDLELLAFTSNVEGVAKVLRERGLNAEGAATFVSLIQSGSSEEEALSQIR